MKNTKPRRSVSARRQSGSAKGQARTTSHVALKGTIAKGERKAELRYLGWDSVAIETLKPDLGRQLIVGQNIMLARVLLKKGCIVPEHSHPNEQVTFILDGALKFWIDGKEIVVNAGEVLTIPPNMPHKAEALEDTVDFDVFTPPRADWMGGTDAYLR